MTPADLLALAIEPALTLLPEEMDTPQARAMLIAIAMEESGLAERHQIRGSAHGWWQFEQIGVAGVQQHHASEEYASGVGLVLDYRANQVATAIEHNDVLAAAYARLLLWQCPQPLPQTKQDEDIGWDQYIMMWRPGKPSRASWLANYRAAWAVVAA